MKGLYGLFLLPFLWVLMGCSDPKSVTDALQRAEALMNEHPDSAWMLLNTLSPDEIDYYVQKYRPLDKAGAYGVQEWIGYIGVEHIEGSYFNVMGLPIQKLYTVLKEFI